MSAAARAAAAAASSASPALSVHRCRFTSWRPHPIRALTLSPSQRYLACARDNGNVEVWDLALGVVRLDVPGDKEMEITSLVWVPSTDYLKRVEDSTQYKALDELAVPQDSSRLLVMGMQGLVLEVSLATAAVVRTYDSFGGAVWSAAAFTTAEASTRLVLGCEDGSVRCFSLDTAGDCEYQTSLAHHKAPVHAVAFSPDGEFVYSGGADGMIRATELRTTRTVGTMVLERLGADKPTVWTLDTLSSGHVVSGDSQGAVVVWDPQFGTVVQAFHKHTADVLAVTATPDGRAIYSAGSDAQVVLMQRVDADDTWKVTCATRPHTHDVNALVVAKHPSKGLMLASGGNDTILAVTSGKPRGFASVRPRKLTSLPFRSVVSMAPATRRMAVFHDKEVNVYQLGSTSASAADMPDQARLQLDAPYEHALQLVVKCRSNLTCMRLSSDAKWLACSDGLSLKLYSLAWDGDSARVRVSMPAGAARELPGARSVAFSHDSKRLVLGTVDGLVRVYSLPQVKLLKTFLQHASESVALLEEDSDAENSDDEDGDQKMGAVAHLERAAGVIITLETSRDGKWLVSGDHLNRIHVFRLDTLQHHWQLPVWDSPHTGVALHPDAATLAVVTAANELFVVQHEDRALSDWSQILGGSTPRSLRTAPSRLLRPVWWPGQPSRLFLQAHSFFCSVNLDAPIPSLKRSGSGSPSKPQQQQKKRGAAPANAARAAKSQRKGGALQSRQAAPRHKAGAFKSPFQHETFSSSVSREEHQLVEQEASNFRMIDRYQPLLCLDFVDGQQVVAVEVPWLEVQRSLPPALERKRYGT